MEASLTYRPMTMKLLDCTLRDGGYYTNWHFERDVVDRYVKNAQCCDAIEIGFRRRGNPLYEGPFKHCTDLLLDNLNIPPGVTVAVMVNMADGEFISTLFTACHLSRVDMVRVAAHPNEISKTHRLINSLKSMGYQTTVNLMRSDKLSNDQLMGVAFDFQSHAPDLDVLYFADSYGRMDVEDVTRIATLLRSEWGGDIGFHAHNNLGRAISNCKAARASGVEWIDGTVLGMGRGAGNANIDELRLISGRPLNDIEVDDDFEALKLKYGWGPNWLYALGARLGIHPMVIQKLCKRTEHRGPM